jgi:hypothetical protein
MRHTFLIASAIGCSVLLTNCKKESDNNSSNDSSAITYQLTTSGSTSSLGRVDVSDNTASRVEGAFVTWTGGYITASEIKFAARGGGNGKVEYKSKVVQRISLFDAIATLGTIVVPPANYKKIEFKIALTPMGSYAAFELNGFYMLNGVPVPIVLRFDSPIEFSFKLMTPESIDFNTNFIALNTLDLNLLLSGITVPMLNNADVVNGTIVIASNSNVTLFNMAWNSLHAILKVKVKKH